MTADDPASTPDSDDPWAERRRAFRELHASGCLAMPKPWDAGSARLLESLGFPAPATTSAGAAWSLGPPARSPGRGRVVTRRQGGRT